jgi:glycosyltransferase involved in cell wall biosynthesis
MKIGIAAMDSVLGSGGGTDIYTRSLVEALAEYDRRNNYIILVNEDKRGAWSYREWPPHVEFAAVYSEEPLHMRAVRHLRHLVGSHCPADGTELYLTRQIDGLDLDLVHFPRTVIFPLSVETPCVVTFFDLQQEYYPEFFTQSQISARSSSHKPSVEKARHVLVPSNFTRWTLIEKYGLTDNKMSLVQVGLPLGFHRPSISEVNHVKCLYGLPEKFIFYPANPWPHKNHARLMAALHIYRTKYGECPWLILSGRLPNERRDAVSLAIAASVEDRVIDLGFISSGELAGVYAAATLMVFPSVFEGFGIPLIEAMAYGCPIAAANATAIPECVNQAALLFDPFDPEAIADSIYELLNNETLREKLVKRGYDEVRRYDWEPIIRHITKIYEQVSKQEP